LEGRGAFEEVAHDALSGRGVERSQAERGAIHKLLALALVITAFNRLAVEALRGRQRLNSLAWKTRAGRSTTQASRSI
jgi:hypothetical protein